MKLEYEISLKDSYVLDHDGLHKLWQFMEEEAGEVKAQARCSDGVRRSWRTWDEFSQFSNSGNARINKLTMTAGDYRGNPWLSVDWVGIIGTEIEIDFDDVKFAAIRDEFHAIIDGMRHGLLTTTRRRVIPGCIGLAAIGTVILPILLYAYTLSRLEYTPNEAILIFVISLVALWVVTVGAVTVYFMLLDHILARVHFAIGQGERRYKNWTKLWAVIGTAILAILVSTLTTLVAIAL